MIAKQPEALRLAHTFDHPLPPEWSDMKAAAAELRRLHHHTEVLRAERDRARSCYDATVKLMVGIHALLYPAPTTMPDGRVMVFRPKSLDPHEVLQELSDRIRALPGELEKVAAIQQATQPTEVTDRDIERVFADHGLVTTKRSMRAARAILALHPQASPDGRGTDVQILKEREIARHAIDGAIAAGYAGATHPGADHWLAAAHNAGMRIAELERAMTPVPCNTFLVRDVAELLGCSVPDVCTAFVQLGRGNRSTNMAITPDEALSVARHLALRPVQSGLTGCNCRWDGDTQVQWCELHLAHKEAIHEWAERAKEAEKQLALRPVQVPMTDEQVDALTVNGRLHWLGKRQLIRAVEAYYGITAQAKKGGE